jgi:hypothetical protein
MTIYGVINKLKGLLIFINDFLIELGKEAQKVKEVVKENGKQLTI